MAFKHTPYIPVEVDGETYYFRLNNSDIAALDRQMQMSFLQALGQRRYDAVELAMYKGFTNPRNPKKIAKVAKTLFDEDYARCVEIIIDALEASGVLRPEKEDESAQSEDSDDDNPFAGRTEPES